MSTMKLCKQLVHNLMRLRRGTSSSQSIRSAQELLQTPNFDIGSDIHQLLAGGVSDPVQSRILATSIIKRYFVF